MNQRIVEAVPFGALGVLTHDIVGAVLNLASAHQIDRTTLVTIVASILLRHAALRLSPTQTRLLILLEKGASREALPGLLGVTPATLKQHITGALRALEAANLTQALDSWQRIRALDGLLIDERGVRRRPS